MNSFVLRKRRSFGSTESGEVQVQIQKQRQNYIFIYLHRLFPSASDYNIVAELFKRTRLLMLTRSKLIVLHRHAACTCCSGRSSQNGNHGSCKDVRQGIDIHTICSSMDVEIQILKTSHAQTLAHAQAHAQAQARSGSVSGSRDRGRDRDRKMRRS